MSNEFHNIDCMEYMKGCADNAFELAIVDPPYGVGMDRGLKGEKSVDKRSGKKIHRKDYAGGWDDKRPSKEYFEEVFRVSGVVIIWGGNFFADLLPVSTHWIYWDKQNPMPSFGDGELAYTNSTKKSIKKIDLPYWGHQTAGEKIRIHPTQKPVKLYEWLLANYAKEGDRILDTHLGSGSSAIAAHYGGFDFVGCELDQDYFEASQKRFYNETSQIDMF